MKFLILPSKDYIFLSVQPKSSFLLTFLVIFDVGDIFFSALTPCYVFLDCSDCSLPISSRQFILELSPGCVDRSWQSSNISEQNLSVESENSLWYGNWLISYIRVYIDFCFTQESNDFRIFAFSHTLPEIRVFIFSILWNSMKILIQTHSLEKFCFFIFLHNMRFLNPLTLEISWVSSLTTFTAQKMKFSIKDFFSKCDQIRSFLRIWSNLLKKSTKDNFSFYALKLRIWSHLLKNLLIENFIYCVMIGKM